MDKVTIHEKDIDELLKEGEELARLKEKEIDEKLSKHMTTLDLAINPINLYSFGDVDYQKKKKEDEQALKDELMIKKYKKEIKKNYTTKLITLVRCAIFELFFLAASSLS